MDKNLSPWKKKNYDYVWLRLCFRINGDTFRGNNSISCIFAPFSHVGVNSLEKSLFPKVQILSFKS